MKERGEHPFTIVPDGAGARERARRIIEVGGCIAFRTDTFYGLGADPFNLEGVGRINRLKEREGRKPVLVVISAREEADRFVAEKTALFDELTKRYWPGALTIVAKALSVVPDGLTAGTGTIGLRLPLDEDVRELLSVCGGALTATSANLAGEPPASTALEAARYFPSELDLIIDGGRSRTDKPSTVLDVSHERARLIREGEISRTEIEKTFQELGEVLE